MSDLVTFLRARLNEDETVARAASPSPWEPNAEHDEVLAVDGITVAEGFALSGNQLRATVEHIARHDPARVLREVEAKRALIELEILRYCDNVPPSGFVSPEVAAAVRGRADTKGLRLLALPYADHPDYDEEWRP